MQTRQTRQRARTRNATAAASASVSASPAPSAPGEDATMSEPGAPGTIHVDFPPDVDLDALSALLPDFDFTNLNEDSAVVLCRLILNQASQVDAAQQQADSFAGELDRKEVELDQALQDRERAVKDLDTSMEKLQEELKAVKDERDQLATSKAVLQAQIDSSKTSSASSSAEMETLKRRVEDVEREKRDLIGVVSRLKEDSAEREAEVNALRASLKQVRQEQQTTESQLRDLRSNETATKFKLDSLSQQLELARSESERANAELTTKTDEFAKYRRTKHAELAQLQATHDALVQTHNSTEATLRALQSSHSQQSHQLTAALARIQDLTGQLAEQEATYASEASSLRRLVGMMEEREAHAKSVVEGIEAQWAEVGARAERRERALKEECEREAARADAAEKHAEQLQRVLAGMEGGELPLPVAASVAGSVPATPARPGSAMGDVLSSGMIGLSPTVAMASRAQKSGRTFTEVYADYVKLQDTLAKRNAEFDHMERTLAAVLAQIEERAPLLAQQRAEYERLQAESSQLATQLSQAIADRDAHITSAHEASQKLIKSTKENELLQKQLTDLGRQVQGLMKEIGRRDDPTIPTDTDLYAEGSGVKPAENIEEVITNNLVLFVSIPQLQEQNMKLLRIVRELGAKMEGEERDYKEQLEREQLEAVREAHEAIQELEQRLENQKRSHDTALAAYMKERETLRGMLARAGQAPPAPIVVSNGAGSGATSNEVEQTETAREMADIQSQFEAYKTETSIDSRRLREEATAAQREVSQLGAQLAKANAKIDYLNDLHRMNKEQYTMQTREVENLQKRNQQLTDQYMRLDIEANRAAEDLLVAQSAVEQMRNELANLRAEQKIWASVQSRLVDENKALALERSHLSDLMANVQRMHSDLERSGEIDRRRLDSQIQMLEGQTQDLRAQLNTERETVRHLTLQKDIEIRELQKKQENVVSEHAKTRELLVSAETSRKHLEIRVEELSKLLQGNEERLAVYERRSVNANGITHAAGDAANLEAEVAELRASLKIAEVDLANARNNVEQFREISSASESALQDFSKTHDEFKAQMEAQIARLESDLTATRSQLEMVQAELQRAKDESAELARKHEADRTAWLNDKKTLEETIVDLSTSEKTSESDRATWEATVREQEQRAKIAEDRYQNELVAHADDIKLVSELRTQLHAANEASRTNATKAETAQAKLGASEASWRQQKDALEKEVTDLSARCKDLASQNSILHTHLESVSSQAARIRQAASSTASLPSEADISGDADTKLAELRSVVAYLRREKEIVDLQLELAKQETVRLKSQIDHLSQTLEETRETLSQERERAVEAAASEAQHAELVERINQLTLLRESNQTLRVDCENYAKRARELDAKIKELSAEIEPTKERARIAEAEVEARNETIARLERENAAWQERNRSLLTKYDRIDPAEVQQLKDEIEKLQANNQAQETAISEQVVVLTQKTELQEKTIVQLRDTGRKNNQIFKERMQRSKEETAELTRTIEELRTQLATVTAERDAAQAQLSANSSTDTSAALTAQVEALTREKANLEKALAEAKAVGAIAPAPEATTELEAMVNALREERDKLLAEKVASVPPTEDGDAVAASKAAWDAEKAVLEKSRDEALASAKVAREQAQKATQVQQNLNAAMQRLQQTRKAEQEKATAQQQAAIDAAVNKALEEANNSQPVDTAELVKKHTEELAAKEAELIGKHQEELEAARAAATAAAAIAASSEDQAAAIAAAVAAREEELKAAHVAEIAAAVERGRMEGAAKMKVKDTQLARTQARLKALEADAARWKAEGLIPQEQPSTNAAGSAPTPTAAAGTTPATTTTPAAAVAAPTAKPAATLPPKPVPAATALRKQPSTSAPMPLATSTGGATLAPASTSVPGPITGAAAGRGRGAAPRGAPAARGARGGARALNIKGANPAAAATAAAAASADSTSAATPPGQVSIMGAAGKRAREESDASTDDSLAKRLKPEGAAAPANAARPVRLNRDRVSSANTNAPAQ